MRKVANLFVFTAFLVSAHTAKSENWPQWASDLWVGSVVEQCPVGSAGVEQRSDPVVVEVDDPERDPLDAFDQVVDRFGRPVRDTRSMRRRDLVPPGRHRAPSWQPVNRRSAVEGWVRLIG